MVSSAAMSMACTSTASLETDLDDDSDTVSTCTSGTGRHNSMVVFDEAAHKDHLAFGNVAITNSSDVHFGNKTYYQGPVTIKQFLYASNGEAALKDGVEGDGAVVEEGADEVKNGDCVEVRQNGDAVGVGEVPVEADVKDSHLWSRNTYIIFAMGMLVFILLSAATLCSLLIVPNSARLPEGSGNAVVDSDEQDKVLEQPDTDFSKNVSFPKKLKIISRIEWVAQTPIQEANNLTLPVPLVIISHTATDNCTKVSLCILIVRHIQLFHVESRGWWDIGYNFLVAGDGNAYMGRGWNKEGAHTYGYNTQSIGIAFIGTFMNVKPPPQQIAACKYLIEKGVELGYIAKDYKLLGARQLQTTESPGKVLFEEIKSWPHWVESLN